MPDQIRGPRLVRKAEERAVGQIAHFRSTRHLPLSPHVDTVKRVVHLSGPLDGEQVGVPVPPACGAQAALVVVEDAAIAHEEAASRCGFEFSERGDAVLTGRRHDTLLNGNRFRIRADRSHKGRM